MWYRLMKGIVKTLLPVFFRIRVFGRGNIPRDGGVIFVSNHQSFLDPLLVGAGVDRPVSYMARRSLFEHNFIFAALMRSVHAFPVARERGDVSALRQTLRRLKRGGTVVVFPEATRTYDGTIGPLKPGSFMLAAKSGVPVVPTVVEGAFEAWPRTKLLPRASVIWVGYGRPIRPEDFGGDTEAMMRECHAELVRIQARLRAGRKGLAG